MLFMVSHSLVFFFLCTKVIISRVHCAGRDEEIGKAGIIYWTVANEVHKTPRNTQSYHVETKPDSDLETILDLRQKNLQVYENPSPCSQRMGLVIENRLEMDGNSRSAEFLEPLKPFPSLAKHRTFQFTILPSPFYCRVQICFEHLVCSYAKVTKSIVDCKIPSTMPPPA